LKQSRLFRGHRTGGRRPFAERRLITRERDRLVFLALEQLKLDRRVVSILHELDEVPMTEVAPALGIPRNTGDSRLRIAREEFVDAVRRPTRRGKDMP